MDNTDNTPLASGIKICSQCQVAKSLDYFCRKCGKPISMCRQCINLNRWQRYAQDNENKVFCETCNVKITNLGRHLQPEAHKLKASFTVEERQKFWVVSWLVIHIW
jgi:hypothetical protein